MTRSLPHFPLISQLSYATLSVGQTTYDGSIVEMPELRIELRPVGDDRLEIGLAEKVTGLRKGNEFGGEGANDPSPFLLANSRYCDTPVLMLTVEHPWRHDQLKF